MEVRNVPRHFGGFNPSVSSAPRAQVVLGDGSNLTPCCAHGFPPAPRLGAIHKSKCRLPLDLPLTPMVTLSCGTTAGGARF